MNETINAVVRVSRHLDASPEQVFDAWLNPEIARKFLFATPTGQMVRAMINVRVGGSFVFIDRREGEDIEHKGMYLEITRPSHLVFSFYVPKYQHHEQNTQVSIVITERPRVVSLP